MSRGLLVCGTVLVIVAGVGACEKINPNFLEPTEAGTGGPGTGTTATSVPADTSTGSDPSTGGLACAPQLESIRIAIFEPKCTNEGCHVGDKPAASLDLVTADLFVDLLDVPSAICADWTRVTASDPTLSILYAKVAGIATCEPAGVDPVDHDLLTTEEQECLAGWIDSIEACERCGGTECIDPSSDPMFCGDCATACPAGVQCIGGTCDCRGLTACGSDCVDVQVDSTNCGDCGNDCNGAACLGGVCDCAIELLNCGACIDPMTDDLHCGGCDQPCGLGETCQGGMCLCSDDPVSFAVDVQPIFSANCVQGSCHGGPMPKQDMSLEEGTAISNIVGVLAAECNDGRFRVAPGDPANSYIMHKVLGVNMCAGVQMPQTGGPGATLSDMDLGTLSAWICQGALDN